MIDKQIIDKMIERIGFDVQQCGYLKITKDALNYPEIGGTFTAFECNLYSRDCDFIERCRYKQLLRKEQECEELKEDRERWKSNFNGKVSAIEELLQQLDQLKQTLAEIKKICNNNDELQDDFNLVDCDKYKLGKHNLANKILQKISECGVKNE